MLLMAAQLIDRLTFAVPATVSFQPAFLLLVPGTVGLAALASSHGSTLGDATATFIVCASEPRRCSRHRDLVCDPKATVAISPSRIGTRGSATWVPQFLLTTSQLPAHQTVRRPRPYRGLMPVGRR